MRVAFPPSLPRSRCFPCSPNLPHALQLGIAGFNDWCSPENDWKLLWLSPLCLWKCMDLVTLHNVTVVVLPLVVNIVLCCTFCMETQILALPANPCYARGGGGRCTTQEVSGGADSFWVSCKTCRLPFGEKKKVSQKESGGFGFLATLLVAEHNKLKI